MHGSIIYFWLLGREEAGLTHLTLRTLHTCGGLGHHVFQLGQVRVRGAAVKAVFGVLLQLLQLGLQLKGLPGGHVHLCERFIHT